MDAAGIRTARDHMLGLPGDAAVIRRVAQHVKQFGVVNGAAIHKGQHRAFPQAADLLVRGRFGQVGGRGAFDDQAEIRVERKRRSCRAAQADFLLDSKYKPRVNGRLGLEQSKQHRAAQAVIDGFGFQKAVAKLDDI